MGKKAELYFKNEFNWNKISEPMYKVIEDLVADANVRAVRVFPERIQQNLYAQIAPSSDSVEAVISTHALTFMQNLWRVLPVGFRHEYGPKLRRTLNSVFR